MKNDVIMSTNGQAGFTHTHTQKTHRQTDRLWAQLDVRNMYVLITFFLECLCVSKFRQTRISILFYPPSLGLATRAEV